MTAENLISEIKLLNEISGFACGLADSGGTVLYCPEGVCRQSKVKPGDAEFRTVEIQEKDGSVFVLFAADPGDGAGTSLTDSALRLLALKLSSVRESSSSRADTLSGILEEREGYGPEKAEGLFRNISPEDRYVLLLFEIPERSSAGGQKDEALAVISGIFSEENDFAVSSFFSDGREYAAVLCRFAYAGTDAGSYCDEAEKFALGAVGTVGAEAMIFTRSAISDTAASAADIPVMRTQALEALHAGTVFDFSGGCLRYDKLALERLICSLPGPICREFVAATLGPRITEERGADELLRTVRVFLDADQNVSEAARKMYIHRNTMTYRLEKFQKLTGLDCSSFGDGLRVRMALLILQYLGEI